MGAFGPSSGRLRGSIPVVNVVNVGISWSLVCGAGPFPELGWDGLAIGTTCGHAIGGLIPFAMLRAGRAGLRVQRRLLRPEPALMRRILRIGLPGGIDVMSLIGLQLVFLSIVNRLSTDEVAAHGVAIRIESLAYLPGSAFQVAAATLAGQFLGAGDPRRATRSVYMACLVCGGLMCAAGVLFFFAADPLVRLFVGDQKPEIVAAAAPLMKIVAFAMPSLALSMVLAGALRGAGDTRWPFVFTLVGFLGIRIPGAYLLTTVWSLGVEGAWWAMVADIVVRSLMILGRFLHGGWKRVKV